MHKKIDNIELDKNNIEFNNAAEFIRHTDKLVYLTGKAGTGKTTFLKYIKSLTEKNTIILAPTGVAAINAGGVTINSFFHMPFGPFIPNDSRLRSSAINSVNKETIFTTFKYNEEKRNILQKLELLIIDEISMVRADTLDVIDRILRVFRGKLNMPFGGVQVLLIGDTFQLPPIADNEQWGILSDFYKSPFFFSSLVIEQNTPLYIELKKIYRQNEQEFIDLLNRVRINNVSENDFKTLNTKYNPSFSGKSNDYIILATHNKIVDETNLTKLNQLDADLFYFEAKITGEYPDKNKPTDQILKLKIDAQIMFIKNDIGEFKRFYNGKIGRIKDINKKSITVIFDDETIVDVERAEWNNIKYTYNKEKKRIEEEIIGTFEQFPLRLAWAITVHKSQGLTFEKVIADLGKAFAPGQVYVALSRCTSFHGLQLKTPLTQYAIKTDPKVLEFAKNETPGTLISEQLNTGKADFFYKKSRENFIKGNFKLAFELMKKSMKYRNDIETILFERYIVVHCTRLFNFKNKFDIVHKENKFLNYELKLNVEIIKNNEIESSKLRQKNSEQNKSLSLLLNRTKEIENEHEQLLKKINLLESKLNDFDKKNKKLKLTQKDFLIEISNKNNEIKRLNSIKWYEKLFGKK